MISIVNAAEARDALPLSKPSMNVNCVFKRDRSKWGKHHGTVGQPGECTGLGWILRASIELGGWRGTILTAVKIRGTSRRPGPAGPQGLQGVRGRALGSEAPPLPGGLATPVREQFRCQNPALPRSPGSACLGFGQERGLVDTGAEGSESGVGSRRELRSSAAAAAPRPRSAPAPAVSSRGSRAGLRGAGGRPRTRLSAAGSAVGVRAGGRRAPGSARGPRGPGRGALRGREWAGRGRSGFPELGTRRGLGSGAGPPALRPPPPHPSLFL